MFGRAARVWSVLEPKSSPGHGFDAKLSELIWLVIQGMGFRPAAVIGSIGCLIRPSKRSKNILLF